MFAPFLTQRRKYGRFFFAKNLVFSLGLALIFCGVLALIVSIWQYRWTIRYMWSPQYRSIAGMRADVTKERMQSPVIAIAVLLACIGIFAFFAVLLRQV